MICKGRWSKRANVVKKSQQRSTSVRLQVGRKGQDMGKDVTVVGQNNLVVVVVQRIVGPTLVLGTLLACFLCEDFGLNDLSIKE